MNVRSSTVLLSKRPSGEVQVDKYPQPDCSVYEAARKSNMSLGSASVPPPVMLRGPQHQHQQQQSRVGTAAVSMVSAGLSQFVHHPVYTFKTHRQRATNLTMSDFFRSTRKSPYGFLFKGVWPRSFGCMPEKMLKMQAYMAVLSYMEQRVKPSSEGGKLATWCVAGCAAGLATTIIGCPAELLMVQAQTGNITVRQFLKRNGLAGMYQGASVAVWRDMAFNMTFFTSRQGFIGLYHRYAGEEPNKTGKFVIGVAAGVLAASLSCPLDVVKTRLQEKDAPKKAWPRLLVRIARREGVRALYHGVGPRCMAVPSMMSLFALLQETFEMHLFGQSILKH